MDSSQYETITARAARDGVTEQTIRRRIKLGMITTVEICGRTLVVVPVPALTMNAPATGVSMGGR